VALGGPGRPGNLPKRWGAKPPNLFGRFPGRPGPPRPLKIDDLRSLKKSYIKNLGAAKIAQKPGGADCMGSVQGGSVIGPLQNPLRNSKL